MFLCYNVYKPAGDFVNLCGFFGLAYIYIYIYNGHMTKTPPELTPQTLIKRVMSGNHDKEYLNAFGKLHIPDLHHPNFSRKDIITLWNSLQTTPNKVRYFTFVLQDNNKIVQDKIKDYYANEKYAYILHDKDKSAGRKHYHYLLMFSSPRSFKSIANDLEMPVTNLQKVYSRKGMLAYLTHENDPSQHHYDLSEITANFDIEEEKKKEDGGPEIDPWQEFCDYVDMKEGRISMKEWFDKYKSILCDITIISKRRVFIRPVRTKSLIPHGFLVEKRW